VQELNFPEPNVGDVNLKIKTVRNRCAAEHAKVIKSDHTGAGLHCVVCLCCSVSGKQIHFYVAYVFPRTSVLTKDAFAINLSAFIV
jgi:hypothetical protein